MATTHIVAYTTNQGLKEFRVIDTSVYPGQSGDAQLRPFENGSFSATVNTVDDPFLVEYLRQAFLAAGYVDGSGKGPTKQGDVNATRTPGGA